MIEDLVQCSLPQEPTEAMLLKILPSALSLAISTLLLCAAPFPQGLAFFFCQAFQASLRLLAPLLSFLLLQLA
tara:strand:- start:859 stop:1077 length:219 start_codon:yes stop_codon:yes gene_type:complete